MEYGELVEVLAVKSGLPEDQVKDQFRLLIEQIDETARAGKALEIRGMGLFYLSTEGDLVFEPTEELATEINYRYAGMEPVLITPGSERKRDTPSSPPGGDEIEKTLSELFGEGETPDDSGSADLSSTDESGEETESGESTAGLATDSQEGESDREEVNEPSPEEKRPERESAAGESDKTTPSTEETPKTEPDKRDSAKTASASGPRKTPVKRRPAGQRGWRRKKKKERDPIRHLIKTLIAVLVLAILFHFTLEELKERGIITDEPILQKEVPPLPEAPEIDEGPWYGMYGTVEPFESYHTISLHAVRDRSRADELAGQLRSEGYRGIVSPVEHPEHGTLWRVSIGQFESEADAERSVLFLPDELRQGTFVTEIDTP